MIIIHYSNVSIENRIEDLNNRPDQALKAFFIDRPYLTDDGQRFSNKNDYHKYQDNLIKLRIEKKKLLQKGRKCRSWYVSITYWITRSEHSHISMINKDEKSSHRNNESNDNNDNEEYIVPADEYFVRCPISKEQFEKIWDENEGEYMYRNAVKILVTQKANTMIYELGKPTNHSLIHYLIVRKPLIVDNWLSEGLTKTLNEAIKYYQSINYDINYINNLISFIETEEDGDDIFVLLEQPAQ